MSAVEKLEQKSWAHGGAVKVTLCCIVNILTKNRCTYGQTKTISMPLHQANCT